MPRSAQPEIASFLKSYRLHIPNFSPVFHWLSENGDLTSDEIAAAFGIQADRVRAIRSRNPASSEVTLLPGQLAGVESKLLERPHLVIPTEDLRRELGIATEPDFVVVSKRREEEIRLFEQQVERDQATFEARWMLEDGLAHMRRHIRDLGQPHSTLLLRILARLRYHSAWFLVHLGRTESAIDQARRAMAISAIAFHESSKEIDLLRIADTGLILSLAYTLRNRPRHALRVLRMISDIHAESKSDPGAEYHRQRGTALLLLQEDEAADKAFIASAAWMHEGGFPERTVLLYGRRQLNLLFDPNWSGALETMISANSGLAEDSLPYQMNVHWAAVTGLATGDKTISEEALSLLGPHPPVSFGHQATIRHLLEVTPRLGLHGKTLQRWCRYLMYANVFRDE
jgi:hypothetical protein